MSKNNFLLLAEVALIWCDHIFGRNSDSDVMIFPLDTSKGFQGHVSMTNSIKYRSKKLSFFHDDCFIMYFFGSLIIHSLFDTLANAGDTSIPHSGVFRRRKMKRPRLCPVHDPTCPILTSFIIWQRQILYLCWWAGERRGEAAGIPSQSPCPWAIHSNTAASSKGRNMQPALSPRLSLSLSRGW